MVDVVKKAYPVTLLRAVFKASQRLLYFSSVRSLADLLKRKFVSAWFFLADVRYRFIIKSGLFDERYYLATNPDLAKWSPFPLVHYLRTGWREGRKPNPFFDPSYYLRQYPDVAADNLEPLSHYVRDGWRKGYQPSCYFFPVFYIQQAPPLPDNVGNPLVHYLCHGYLSGRKPSPYFDPVYYLRTSPDAATSGMTPHYHYLMVGAREHRRPSPFFDVEWYLDRTPVLRTLDIDPLFHYLEFGAGEGKSPVPLFDPCYYREQNSDVGGEKDLLTHYLTNGLADDRLPGRWFDPDFYRRTYPQSMAQGLSPFQHYLEYGVHEQCYPDRRVQELSRKPLISLVVPVYNVQASYLNSCIRSVLYQAYPHWELCLADDCSSQPHIRPLLEQWALRDARIKVTFLENNQGISAATNAAAALASGEYVAFLDNDDELTVDCLYQVVKVIAETGADLLYTDEDLIGDDGSRFNIFCKPRYNRELLLCHNYITHLVVSSKGLFDAVGGLDPRYDGAQDYDLILKLSEQAKLIEHIPKVLYHWRASETSTSINHQQKSYADAAGRNALEAAVQRRGIDAEVQATDWKFYYMVARKLQSQPLVSLLVCWPTDSPGLASWVRSLVAATGYARYEIIVVMHQKSKGYDADNQVLNEMDDICAIFYGREGEGQASLYNLAVEKSRGDYLVFLDCEIRIDSPDWLDCLLAQAQERGTGVVAPRLLCAHGRQGKMETLPDLGNTLPWYFIDFFEQCSIHMNGLQCSQNVMAPPWGVCVVAKCLFAACGGFDERSFPHFFWYGDFCLRLRELGVENVYLPKGLAEWKTTTEVDEGVTTRMGWEQERTLFQKRWEKQLVTGDPYYNLGVLQKKQLFIEDFLFWYAGYEPKFNSQ